ncbi:hypothetical protein E4T44_01687 [Aureobasidium sp. EXF-8845]|nr:hypothetical protein E4T45_05708 [Aureobasidium sp. EXF-8846]KAI4852134.1 hypothetical protein E4T44_01687 [Aureobasidium sp. EXF-8845]
MSTSSSDQSLGRDTTQTFLGPATRAVSSLCKSPPGACFNGAYITVEVGSNKKKYIMHKDLLVYYSDYFRAAFNGCFREATDGKITLLDECEHIFEIFNQFVYSRRITDGVGHKLSWETLIETWLFGDKHMVPALQNALMDAMLEEGRAERSMPTALIAGVWEKTLPSSPLRRYMLDRTVYCMTFDTFRTCEHRYPREALVDVIGTYANKDSTKKLRFPSRGKCYYHVHKEGEKC